MYSGTLFRVCTNIQGSINSYVRTKSFRQLACDHIVLVIKLLKWGAMKYNANKDSNYRPDRGVWILHQYLRLLHRKRYTYVLENLVFCRITLSTASKKSRSEATFRLARIANIPAFFHSCEHKWTNGYKSTVPLSQRISAQRQSHWCRDVLSGQIGCHARRSC